MGLWRLAGCPIACSARCHAADSSFLTAYAGFRVVPLFFVERCKESRDAIQNITADRHKEPIPKLVRSDLAVVFVHLQARPITPIGASAVNGQMSSPTSEDLKARETGQV